MTDAPARNTPVIVIHAVAALGVLFWIGMVVDALRGGFPGHVGAVIVLAIVLGGAHALISYFIGRAPAVAVWLSWLIFVSDSALGIFVNPKAFILAGATVILLVASYAVVRSQKG